VPFRTPFNACTVRAMLVASESRREVSIRKCSFDFPACRIGQSGELLNLFYNVVGCSM